MKSPRKTFFFSVEGFIEVKASAIECRYVLKGEKKKRVKVNWMELID